MMTELSDLDLLPVSYGTVDPEYALRLASTPPDDDRPVWMVNLMKYRDRAEYADGRETTLRGQEADDLYAPFGPLAAVGAQIVFVASVEDQLLGDSPRWDRVAVVQYPTGRSFIEMSAREDFRELHVHKEAGMEQTIVMGCRPIGNPEVPADAPGWNEVPHPATPEDGPVVVIHVLRFAEGAGAGRDEMDSYTSDAGKVAVPHGVRIAGWMGVDGTIIGDGRQWDEVRFNAFPSKAAFMAVALDPARLEAQTAHREPAIADTYTMILRPVVDELGWAR
jgi:hypothetical protein